MVKLHRRSLFEIYYELLSVINEHGPIKPTKLMYAVNVSWSPLHQCLKSLEEIGLVEWVNLTTSKRGELILTQKGGEAYKGITNYVSLLIQARDKIPIKENKKSSDS